MRARSKSLTSCYYPKCHGSIVAAALVGFAAACGAPSPSDISQSSIIGGRPAVGRGFMAGLTIEGADRNFCGGAFIAPDVVLTAAHCLDDSFEARLRVSAGLTRNGDHWSARTYPVRAVVLHPEFTDVGDHDLALLFVDNDAAGEDRKPLVPIEMESRLEFPEMTDDLSLTAIGWGRVSSFGYLSDDTLMEVRVPAIPMDACRAADGYQAVHERVICAGDLERGGADSCQGDSGGPLIAERDGHLSLVGITSWGISCAQKRRPGVYTRVASYRDWIVQTIADYRAAPVEPELSDAAANRLFREFCYAPLASAIEQRSDAGLIRKTAAFALWDDLVASADAEPDGPVLARCSFSRPGDDRFEASIRAKGDGHEVRFTRLRDQHAWTAAVSPSERLTMACGTGDSYLRIVDGLGWFNHVLFSGIRYKFYISAEIPAEATELRRCDVNGYAATVLRKDKTTYVRLSPPGADPATGAGQKFLELYQQTGWGNVDMTFAAASDVAGKLTVKNTSDTDIFTWELACDFPLELTGADGQLLQPAIRADGRFVHRFDYPSSAYGAIPTETGVDFSYQSQVSLPAGAENHSCEINNTPATMQVVAAR